MKIRLYNAVGRMDVYLGNKKIQVSADVENYLRTYMSKTYGRDSFIYVGQEATIDLPEGLEVINDNIELKRL